MFFGWVLHNKNQSNYSNQSDKMQTIEWPSQDLKLFHICFSWPQTKEIESKQSEQVTIGFGFASHWFRKLHKSQSKVMQTLLLTLN